MPRFRLTPGDAADLVAYMRELGSKPDPGVSAEAITIGVIIPQREQLPAVHDAVRDVLRRYIDELNRIGGIFGRRIELAFVEAAIAPDFLNSATRVEGIEETVLAVVVSDAVDVEHEITALTRHGDVPLVAVRADKDLSPARHVFYLSAGVTGELGALAAQAARQLTAGSARLAILYADSGEDRERVMALRPLIERGGWSMIDEIVLPAAGMPDDLPEPAMRRIEASDTILFAGWDRRSAKILSHLGRAGRSPLVLLASTLTSPKSLPRDMDAKTRILFAFEPNGSPPSVEIPDTQPAQSPPGTTLAAVKLLVEGLRRAGRDVSRTGLIDALQTIQRFEAGYGAPLSYGPRQHIGFTGAEIVPLDPQRLRAKGPASRIQLH
jgi:ABC-type branched-subunit amino acid transport system substrate-binding protein